MSTKALRLSTHLQRKDPRLPVYVVVPGWEVRPWGLAGTTVIEGTANGISFGRRTIKRWGKGVDDWFVDFTAAFCKAATLGVGDRVDLELRIADASTPVELDELLSKDKGAEAAWRALPERARRDSAEHVRAAKSAATRERRAVAIVDKLRSVDVPDVHG